MTLIIFIIFVFIAQTSKYSAKTKPQTKRVIRHQNRTKKLALTELAAMCVAKDTSTHGDEEI